MFLAIVVCVMFVLMCILFSFATFLTGIVLLSFVVIVSKIYEVLK